MDAVALAPFPAAPRAAPSLSDRLAALEVTLRPATSADLPFLRQLYAESRAAELLAMPWPAAEKAAFCDGQFALQHDHYLRHYPRADFWIVTQAENGGAARDIGRFTVLRKSREWRAIDMMLAADARGQGLGTALIEWLQASARTAGANSLALSVAHDNPRAQALYRRLGFVDCGANGPMHAAMEWRVIRP